MTSAATAPGAPLVSDFPSRASLAISVPVDADQPTAFAAITDWAAQSRWMLGTRVWVSRGTGRAVGDELSGFTGVGAYSREPGSNGLAIDAQGRLLLCEHGDRRVSRVEMLYVT